MREAVRRDGKKEGKGASKEASPKRWFYWKNKAKKGQSLENRIGSQMAKD